MGTDVPDTTVSHAEVTSNAGASHDNIVMDRRHSACRRVEGSEQQQQQQHSNGFGTAAAECSPVAPDEPFWPVVNGDERLSSTSPPAPARIQEDANMVSGGCDIRSVSPAPMDLPGGPGRQEHPRRSSLLSVDANPFFANKRNCRFASNDALDAPHDTAPPGGSGDVPRGNSRDFSGHWSAASIHSERSPCPSPSSSSCVSSGHYLGSLAEEPATSASLQKLLRGLDSGDLDQALLALAERQRYLQWKRLPDRIILLRHGESEGNINRSVYTTKGDALLELTPKGLQQAQATGARLRELIKDDNVFVCLSPFERTQQTLLGLFHGGFPEQQVAKVLISSQIREQEFGNFQSLGTVEAAKAEASVVGRFYYRRPNAESSADVYDRVSAFWDQLLSAGNDGLLMSQKNEYGTCLIVTHGLTVRLLMMKIFQWSVETFETVWNIGNCDYITLRKDMRTMTYSLCKAESYPRRLPWATRPVWVVFKSKKAEEETEKKLRLLMNFKASDMGCRVIPAMRSDEASEMPGGQENFERLYPSPREFGEWPEIDRAIDETQSRRMRQKSGAYTVVDYLSIPQPRTVQRLALKGKLLEGHKFNHKAPPNELLEQAQQTVIDWDDVELVDWWGDRMSFQGKMLRVSDSVPPPLLHTSSVSRTSLGYTDNDEEDPATSMQAAVRKFVTK